MSIYYIIAIRTLYNLDYFLMAGGKLFLFPQKKKITFLKNKNPPLGVFFNLSYSLFPFLVFILVKDFVCCPKLVTQKKKSAYFIGPFGFVWSV